MEAGTTPIKLRVGSNTHRNTLFYSHAAAHRNDDDGQKNSDFFFSFFLSCRVTATGRYWKFISHMYSLISQLWRGSAGQMLSAVSSHGRQTEQKDCASLGQNSGGVGWRRLMMFDPVCVCEWTPGASTEQHQTDAGATVTLASTPKFNRTRGSSSRFTDTLHWGQKIWKQDQICTKRKKKRYFLLHNKKKHDYNIIRIYFTELIGYWGFSCMYFAIFKVNSYGFCLNSGINKARVPHVV